MRIAKTIFLVLTTAACGGGDGSDTVTITTVTAPELMMVRDDAVGTWVPLTSTDPTTFTYQPTGPYRITAGCDEGDGFFSLWQVARTPADDPEVEIFCGTAPRTATITTTMVQSGEVRLEDSIALSSVPDWQVVLETAPGTHDLFAVSDDHALIGRGLQVIDELTLPAIDVVTSGIALVPASIEVANALSDETVTANVTAVIGDTFGRVSRRGAPADAKQLPESALQSGDQQILAVSTSRSDGSSRFASKQSSGAVTFTLPDPMGATAFSVAGGEVTATWNATLAGDVSLTMFANTPDFSTIWFHDLEVSESYAASLDSAVTFEIDDVPNVPAELLFDLATEEHDRAITISHGTTEREGVSASALFNTPPPEELRAAHPRVVARKLALRQRR